MDNDNDSKDSDCHVSPSNLPTTSTVPPGNIGGVQRPRTAVNQQRPLVGNNVSGVNPNRGGEGSNILTLRSHDSSVHPYSLTEAAVNAHPSPQHVTLSNGNITIARGSYNKEELPEKFRLSLSRDWRIDCTIQASLLEDISRYDKFFLRCQDINNQWNRFLYKLSANNKVAVVENYLFDVYIALTPVKDYNKCPVFFMERPAINFCRVVSHTSIRGLSKSAISWNDVEHKYDDQQRAEIKKVRKERLEEQKKLFADRKLSLVLDLDNTLLNSAKFCEIDAVHEKLLQKKEKQDKEKPCRHLFRSDHMELWTKLRPGVWNFLLKASKLFEMHLNTMGNKLYAYQMAKILDPKGVLFAGRVTSRGDDEDYRALKIKTVEEVLGMESSIVIIDDSIGVWPFNKLNVIVAKRYIYFPCSRLQFGLQGPSILESEQDERAESGPLSAYLSVIERLHETFFSCQELDLDVRYLLAAEQRQVLNGCRIIFSGVFPQNEANPQSHPLWIQAEKFGANCTNKIEEGVTHVVAVRRGTDKVSWGFCTQSRELTKAPGTLKAQLF